MRKFLALILAMLLLAIQAAPALAESRVYVYKETPRFFYRSSHRAEFGWKSYPNDGEDVGTNIFRLVRTMSDGSKIELPAYCTDLLMSAVIDTAYERINLEDSTYYSDEAAGHIRSILRNGFWVGRNVSDLARASGVTGLTAAEALTATQAAIWYYSNAEGPGYYPSLKNAYHSTVPFSEADSAWNEIKDPVTVDATEEASSQTGARINAFYQYLINQDPTDAQSVIWSFSGEHVILSRKWQKMQEDGTTERPTDLPTNWKDILNNYWEMIFGNWGAAEGNEEGTYYYQVLTRFKVKGTPKGVKNLTLRAVMNAEAEDGTMIEEVREFDLTDAKVIEGLTEEGSDYWTIAFGTGLTAKEFENDPIVTLTLIGEQELEEDVYMYVPMDGEEGREMSQSMVGIGGDTTLIDVESEIDISEAFSSIYGVKLYEGKMPDSSYTFRLTNVTDPENPIDCGTTKSNQFGDFRFANVHFEKAGTYLFEVREIPQTGMIGMDTTVYEVTVEVVRDNGVLIARPMRITKPDTKEEIVFNNRSTGELIVRKEWDLGIDAEGKEIVPPVDSVQVQLYCDGEPYGAPVTLSAANNWTRTWSDMDATCTWSVKEITDLQGMHSVVVRDGNAFVIINGTLTETGDASNLALWSLCVVLGVAVLIAAKRRPAVR